MYMLVVLALFGGGGLLNYVPSKSRFFLIRGLVFNTQSSGLLLRM